MFFQAFWDQALPTFLESTVFWLYLNYAGYVIRLVLETPILPTSSWDPVLQICICSFLTDYIWRRFLCVGNCIDPAFPIISIAQKRSRGDFWPIFISCNLSGVVVYLVSEAVSPVSYAKYHRHRGLLFCFLIEFLFDFMHQARNATWAIIEARLKQLQRLELETSMGLRSKPKAKPTELKGKTETVKEASSAHPTMMLRMKACGIHCTASFITASIVSFSSYFTTGGVMLNITYTIMASLAHKDLSLLFVLGTANLLSAYMAGLYVNISIECMPLEDEIPKGMVSQATSLSRDELEMKKIK